jgi:hypothetical protein
MIAPMHALFPGLNLRNVGTEVLAGITLLAIALPLNIGYAQIAGLPPSAGLYALVLPSAAFALLGRRPGHRHPVQPDRQDDGHQSRQRCGVLRAPSPHRSSSATPPPSVR